MKQPTTNEKKIEVLLQAAEQLLDKGADVVTAGALQAAVYIAKGVLVFDDEERCWVAAD